MMHTRRLLTGAATYVPGLARQAARRSEGTNSARYCYSVWMRHLVSLNEIEAFRPPTSVAELGPGDSLGTGLSALLCGADTYTTFDVEPYASVQDNLAILEQLVALFQGQARIPGNEEFPLVMPRIADYEFPHSVLPSERLLRGLAPERVAAIRAALEGRGRDEEGISISYMPRWDALETPIGEVDLIFSQAVLEHVDDLPATYGAMSRALASGGFMSHSIDFSSHGTARTWNGHWTFSDLEWRLIRGRRRYLINREPYSSHRALLEHNGFDVVYEQRTPGPTALDHRSLARRFADLTDDDLATRNIFLIARKA